MPDEPVARVVRLLEDHGFRSQTMPITIGPIDHDFPAVLLGSDRSLDLVVVVDTLREADEKRIRQKIRGLAHALDVVRSRRSLSVVVVGPRLTPATARAVGLVARVLNAGTTSESASDTALRESLSVLLPLDLPAATTGPADALGSLRKRVGGREQGALLRSLVAAASAGADSVSAALKRDLERALELEWGEDS